VKAFSLFIPYLFSAKLPKQPKIQKLEQEKLPVGNQSKVIMTVAVT
jgi:hypothetical protein